MRGPEHTMIARTWDAIAADQDERLDMKLCEVLDMVAPYGLPDMKDWNKTDVDFRSQTVFRVRICTMADEETWTETYPENPILIPWYDAEVYGLSPTEENVLDIWIKHEEYVREHLKAWKDGDGDG